MIQYDSTQTLRLVVSGAGSVINLLANFTDVTTTGFALVTPLVNETLGAGTHTAGLAPAASTVRILKNLVVHNSSVNTSTVEFGVLDPAFFFEAITAELESNEVLFYDENGFSIRTAKGLIKAVSGTGFPIGNLSINQSNLQILSAADPTPPAAGRIILYSKEIGGRQLPKIMPPSGVDFPLQAGMFFNNVSLIQPGSGTVPSVIGCVLTNVGTVAHPVPAATNLLTQTRRFSINSGGTAGSLASLRIGVLECWRGNNTRLGGFFIVERFAMTVLAAGMRSFHGLTDTAVTAPTNIDPTTATTPAKIGMAINNNAGNWNLVHNTSGVAPTIIALGANFPVNTTDLLEMILFAKPNDSVVTYRIKNLTTGNETSGTLSTNLPANTAFLGRTAWATNNATAAAVEFIISRFGLETDF